MSNVYEVSRMSHKLLLPAEVLPLNVAKAKSFLSYWQKCQSGVTAAQQTQMFRQLDGRAQHNPVDDSGVA